MGVNFKVAMILEAVNNMNPGIRRAMDSVNRLRNRITSTARETSRINPVRGWEDKIAQASKCMEEFGRKAESVRKQAEKLMLSGVENLAVGGSIAAPVVAAVKPAADLQTKLTTMQVMGLSDEGKNAVVKQSMGLAKNLAFDLSQVVGVAQSLQKAGMNEAKIMQAQKTATNYAQLEYNRYGSDPNQTATHLAHIAESAGVLYATKQEREQYGLNTQSDIDRYIVGKFERMAETLNKVVSVTSSDTATLAESIKYSMPAAKSLGWSEESAMLMSGIYSRFGIEGSMSGTHLKDFASRLNPYQHYIGEDVEKKSNRLTAMQEAGWLEGAQWSLTKTGQKKFSSAGKSVFHNDDGTLKGPDVIFGKIYEAYERFNREGKRLQFEGILHDVLGEQGKDIAQLLNQNPEMFKHIKEDMAKVLSMEKSLEKYQDNVNTQWDIFTGNISTARTQLGNLLLEDVSSTLKGWNEKLFGKTNEASPVAQWIEDHKELISWIMKSALVFAGLTMGMGILKIAAAGLKFALVSPLMTGVGWMGKLLKGAVNLKTGFDLVRATGSGFGKSIVKGAELAWPWLEKLKKWSFVPVVKLAKWIAGCTRIFVTWIAANGKIAGVWLATNGHLAGVWLLTQIKLCGAWILSNGRILGVWLVTNGRLIGIWIATHGKMVLTAALNCARIAGVWIASTGRMVAVWLANAARIAAGWLIAMGPPGWIILAVTALIAAGVAAWKTNFMGFRDKCISVWNAVKDWSKKTWDSISGFVGGAIDKVSGFIDKVKSALGFASDLEDKKGGLAFSQSYYSVTSPAAEAFSLAVDSPYKFMSFGGSQDADNTKDHSYQKPYLVQPLMYGGNAQGFSQTNNIKVNSNKEAAEFARQAVPDKYKSASNNPSNYAGIPRGETGEAV